MRREEVIHMGRLPSTLKELQEGGEQNIALALDEQEVWSDCCAQLGELFVLVMTERDKPTLQGGARIRDSFKRLFGSMQKAKELDIQDEENGREHINKPTTILIRQREPLVSRAALTHTVRV